MRLRMEHSQGNLYCIIQLLLSVLLYCEEYFNAKYIFFISGLYARVYRARSRKTGALYAAKCSPKRAENYNEIRLLSRIRNHFIISFKDAFSTPMNLVIIMEL